MTSQSEHQHIDSEIKQNKWGPRFKAAREAMHLTEKDAAARLHLKPHIISTIEAERFQSGPPPIFMRGYVKSYAKLLNFTDKEIEQILLQLSVSHPEIINTSRAYRTQRFPQQNRNYSGWMTAVVILVLAVLVGVWWNNHSKTVTNEIALKTEPSAEVNQPQNLPTEPTPHELLPQNQPIAIGTPGTTVVPNLTNPQQTQHYGSPPPAVPGASLKAPTQSTTSLPSNQQLPTAPANPPALAPLAPLPNSENNSNVTPPNRIHSSMAAPEDHIAAADAQLFNGDNESYDNGQQDFGDMAVPEQGLESEY